jgi:hypothetical protein
MRPELQSVAKHRNESEHSPAVLDGSRVVTMAICAARPTGSICSPVPSADNRR